MSFHETVRRTVHTFLRGAFVRVPMSLLFFSLSSGSDTHTLFFTADIRRSISHNFSPRVLRNRKTTTIAMSEQSQTTKAPSDPVLCKMGCGFFGSGATGDCCSKCWIALQKKEEATCKAAPAPVEVASNEKTALETVEETPSPMDIDEAAPSEATPKTVSAETPKKKKKKKKTSYKSMMAGMMKADTTSKDVEKEKEVLRKVTGGGAFSKIDKI